MSSEALRSARRPKSLARTVRSEDFARRDIDFWEAVRPLGASSGLYVLRKIGGDGTEVIASTAVGRRTWEPGEQVTTASRQNEQRRIVVGPPPPGRKGAESYTTTNPPVRPIGGGFELLAFSVAGSLLYADIWGSGGGFLRARTSPIAYTGDDVDQGRANLIAYDSAGLVGNGSLVVRDSTSSLRVWDVEGATQHTYTASAGWNITPAVYVDGLLWWIESENASDGSGNQDIRLRTAKADLTSATTIVEETITNSATSTTDLLWSFIAVTSSEVWAIRKDGGAGQYVRNIMIERDGSGHSAQQQPIDAALVNIPSMTEGNAASGAMIPVVAIGGAAVGAVSDGEVGGGRYLVPGTENDGALATALPGIPSFGVGNAHVMGGLLLAYTRGTDEDPALFWRTPITTGTASPTAVNVSDHPTTTDPPGALFLQA